MRSDNPSINNSYARMRGKDLKFINSLILNKKIKICCEMDGDGIGIEVVELRHKCHGKI